MKHTVKVCVFVDDVELERGLYVDPSLEENEGNYCCKEEFLKFFEMITKAAYHSTLKTLNEKENHEYFSQKEMWL